MGQLVHAAAPHTPEILRSIPEEDEPQEELHEYYGSCLDGYYATPAQTPPADLAEWLRQEMRVFDFEVPSNAIEQHSTVSTSCAIWELQSLIRTSRHIEHGWLRRSRSFTSRKDEGGSGKHADTMRRFKELRDVIVAGEAVHEDTTAKWGPLVRDVVAGIELEGLCDRYQNIL